MKEQAKDINTVAVWLVEEAAKGTDMPRAVLAAAQRLLAADQPAATETGPEPLYVRNKLGQYIHRDRLEVALEEQRQHEAEQAPRGAPYECNCPAPYPEAVHDLTCPEHLKRFPEDAPQGALPKCEYHPIYRECSHCGAAMNRGDDLECPGQNTKEVV